MLLNWDCTVIPIFQPYTVLKLQDKSAKTLEINLDVTFFTHQTGILNGENTPLT